MADTKNTMVFRKATRSDISSLIEFRRILLKKENDLSMDNEFTKYFLTALADGSLVAWVVEDDGVIISAACFCICQLMPRFDNPSGLVAYMANVYTTPSYCCKGIASKLIRIAIDDLKTQGVEKLLLHSSDMAKTMYTKLGFVENNNYMTLDVKK